MSDKYQCKSWHMFERILVYHSVICFLVYLHVMFCLFIYSLLLDFTSCCLIHEANRRSKMSELERINFMNYPNSFQSYYIINSLQKLFMAAFV